jgi:hypothetical protein
VTENQPKHPRQILPKGCVERRSYLGERGESFVIRASGKGDVKVVNLINRATFALADVFFTSEEEARLFAAKRHLTIVEYSENASLASHGQER